MDVYEQARTEARTLTNRDLKRNFKRACSSWQEYVALTDMPQAVNALRCIDAILDEWLGRRR